ncbi:phosphogluconate dehydrogenase (NAD(+)-dependent, decarboxylating) [Streptococcus parauberis]|uniref:phosphogluconate dehydrogenase (NAD(+)-dependent, decarboxylating) n=1 Tax=Streptococcus parauberis TaxID=1348 RepID=UPI0021563CB0|nr:decarboxylating 6-phosphogluconate dehydrogenase [Streptococcus parauberis]
MNLIKGGKFMKSKIGIIGLGKMGLNIALNAQDNGWQIFGFDVESSARENAKLNNIKVLDTLGELLTNLDEKKVILLSTPAGDITNNLIIELGNLLNVGDIVIDSGNSKFSDSLNNYNILSKKGISFIDCGTSGGVSGARNGACLMIGGDQAAYEQIEDFFNDISIENGCIFVPSPSAGHYLKMVHNGIEYGMMQAIGEGFAVLQASNYDFDFAEVSKVWNNGSVVRSWLIELAEEEFKKDPKLDTITGLIDANGEAKWTVEEALRMNVPVPVIANSLFVRNESQLDDSFSNKVVASLRRGFGGHAVKMKG